MHQRRECSSTQQHSTMVCQSAVSHHPLVSCICPHPRVAVRHPTSGRPLVLLGILAVQVLEQLHGLAGHDDLLEHRLQEGHHGGLAAVANTGLVSSGAPAGRVTQPFLATAIHRLRHAVQGVGGVPEVPVVHWHVFVPDVGGVETTHLVADGVYFYCFQIFILTCSIRKQDKS